MVWILEIIETGDALRRKRAARYPDPGRVIALQGRDNGGDGGVVDEKLSVPPCADFGDVDAIDGQRAAGAVCPGNLAGRKLGVGFSACGGDIDDAAGER